MTSGDINNDINDVIVGINNLTGTGGFSATVADVINEIKTIRNNNPNARFDITGHSLGAIEATVLYNINGLLVAGDTVTALSPPVGVPSSAMLPSVGAASYSAYGGLFDAISGGEKLNLQRKANGVSIFSVDTATGWGSHDRCKYQIAVYGRCIY